jgi:hypothetical protein
MVLGKLKIHMEKNKIDPYLSPATKINSRWINDLHVKTRNYESTRRKHRRKLSDNGINKTSRAQETKQKWK